LMSKFAALPDPTRVISFPQQIGSPGGVGTTIGSGRGGCFGGSIGSSFLCRRCPRVRAASIWHRAVTPVAGAERSLLMQIELSLSRRLVVETIYK
jgi:hypothetical protein